jgi:hypothetical protein
MTRSRKKRARYRAILCDMRSELSPTNGQFRIFRMCGIIRALRRNAPSYFNRKAVRKTREDARAILKCIGHLEDQIHRDDLAPELRLRLGLDVPSLKGTPADLDKMPVPQLVNALKIVRDLCEAGVKNQPSEDQIRIWCAKTAHTLMVRFSTKKPSSGSADSSYRVIAGLLYEILTGERERDLKRACDDELKAVRTALREVNSTFSS